MHARTISLRLVSVPLVLRFVVFMPLSLVRNGPLDRELADRNSLYDRPMHPYTHALLSAVPIPDPNIEMNRQRIILEGDIPSPANPPPGCRFNTRCPKAVEGTCDVQELEFRELEGGHWVACHFSEVRQVF